MLKALRYVILTGLAIAIAGGLTGCDLVHEDSDCVGSYNMVRFTYDHNMKFADAFDHEVEAVTLLVFDSESGKLVKRITADAEELDDSNSLPLDIAPGKYDLLVWGGNLGESFDVTPGSPGESNISDFHAYMHRLREEEKAHVRDELSPLFHGLLTSVTLPYAAPSKPNKITIPLKKDTNSVRVVLQQLSGDPLEVNDFVFTITDANGWLNHDNTLRGNELITYHPWHLYSGSVDINTNAQDPAETRTSLGAALAEFTTSRLTTVADPILTITRRDGIPVLSINIRDYAMLVKGHHNAKGMDDQEYLDRQDEYNMTFFLDKDYNWLSTVVIINDWRIVFNEGPVE